MLQLSSCCHGRMLVTAAIDADLCFVECICRHGLSSLSLLPDVDILLPHCTLYSLATTQWLQYDQTLPLFAKGVACKTEWLLSY